MQSFEDLRPYNDDEVCAATQRIISNLYFPWLVNKLAPDWTINEARNLILNVKTIEQFQESVSFAVLERIISASISNFTCSGIENINTDKNYLYISNHRDIILDAGLFNLYLFKNKLDTTEITFGSNLMKNELSKDLEKLNRMFYINRSGNIRDLYKNYIDVSSYIRYVLTEKKRSVWIAQRNGRTKDGDDKTEAAVLKMFTLSKEDSFVNNLAELEITPISVSYEYEPCIFMKTAELFISSFTKYEKSENEDYKSILIGITEPKGHVNLSIAKSITTEELEYCDTFEKNEKFTQLAHIINKRIYDNYVIEKNNYIAYDMLTKRNKFKSHYSENEKKTFIEYMTNGLNQLNMPRSKSDLEFIFLNIYANPIKKQIQE